MKKFTYIFIIMACLAMIGWFVANAAESQNVPNPGFKAFERMKEAIGVWEGTSNMGKADQTIKIGYRLTAGGSAIVETLFPDTAEEMISVYHVSGDQLAMTHYCMLGNQPRMKLKTADETALNFVFAEGNDIDPAKDSHMHAVTISFPDKDHMIQKWTMFENGQDKGVTTMTLSRLK